MPNHEARAAFDEIKLLSTALHALVDREQQLVERIHATVSVKQLDEVEAQVAAMYSVWSDLIAEYTAAIKTYAAAVRKTLRPA